MEIKQFSENALTIHLGDEIDEQINRQLVALRHRIEEMTFPGIEEIVLSYTSLIIYFDIFKTDVTALREAVGKVDESSLLEEKVSYRVIEIPVCYGGEYGPDIESFESDGLSPEEVIALHANKEYLVYMLGFMPGFPYLGGLDERLYKARLETPRVRIPPGSVGIGGKQTGMYPFESPGGWHLLGRTPVPLFDRGREEQILYEAGDRIVYRPIDQAEFKEIAARIKAGEYDIQFEVREG
ncbi:5-oxoprolinase subunit PxpB [Salinicoccus sesuvii]|uniref:5-oxoprolinase subunit PxpB n=1 Tax=Salinicoccus sesuvii TaxID=868281 RepID=A0ABV7N5W0_9STAP